MQSIPITIVNSMTVSGILATIIAVVTLLVARKSVVLDSLSLHFFFKDIKRTGYKMEFSPAHMEKLVELLRPPEPEVLQGDDLPASVFDITSTRGKIPPPEEKTKTPKTIEEYEEQEAKEIDNLGRAGTGLGDLKTPEYTMNYRQSVSAEDVFLQLGPKTPGSASCENLIVRVKMPGDKMENVDLVVDTTSVTVTSSQYSLKLPLPHEIDPDRSKASWEVDQETLVLTLRLNREFDFVNF